MEYKKEKTCSFTGHRLQKLEKNILILILIKRKIKSTIKKTITKGYTHFISGMALGIDLFCAEIISKLKKKNINITLECAIPCKDQTYKWKIKDKEKYNRILDSADIITMVSDKPYFSGCMQKRNKYMVDKSSYIIGVYNGSNGGTKQTLAYAKQKNIKITIINV